MSTLKLAPDFALPLDAVTRTFAILAQKGAGKSNAAAVMVEQMISHRLPIVVIDPTGGWWGLSASRDGRGDGFPITVVGGDHGDVPIEAEGGAIIADLVIEERVPLVIDLSNFSINEQRHFVADFAEQLYKKNRDPLHVVIDEADEFAPQRIPQGHERMFGAIDRIVRRGRQRGLGVTMISQRSAVLNKDVLSQIDTLIALRTTSPLDRKAIKSWLEQTSPRELKEMMDELAGLSDGTAWIWSPSWLKEFRRVKISLRVTFDSSATPKVGEKRVTPRRVASEKLDVIKTRMAEVIERVKRDDPKVLKTQIKELERQLATRPKTVVVPEKIVERVEVPVLTAEQTKLLEGYSARLNLMHDDIKGFEAVTSSLSEALRHAVLKTSGYVSTPVPEHRSRARAEKTVDMPTVQKISTSNDATPRADASHLRSGAQRMYEILDRQPHYLSRWQLGKLTNIAPKGSTFSTYISELKRDGLVIESERGITTRSRSENGFATDDVLSGKARLHQWEGSLRDGVLRMLKELAACPGGLTRQELSERTGIAEKGSTFSTYISELKRAELAVEDTYIVAAVPWVVRAMK